MATLRKRNGRWQVQVRRSGAGSLSKTFNLKADALKWAREKDLRAYTNELGKYNPGDKVEVSVERAGETVKLEIVLAKR